MSVWQNWATAFTQYWSNGVNLKKCCFVKEQLTLQESGFVLLLKTFNNNFCLKIVLKNYFLGEYLLCQPHLVLRSLGHATHNPTPLKARQGSFCNIFLEGKNLAAVVHLFDESSSQHMFNAWMNELFKCIWRLWQTPVNRQILIKMSFGTRYLPSCNPITTDGEEPRASSKVH